MPITGKFSGNFAGLITQEAGITVRLWSSDHSATTHEFSMIAWSPTPRSHGPSQRVMQPCLKRSSIFLACSYTSSQTRTPCTPISLSLRVKLSLVLAPVVRFMLSGTVSAVLCSSVSIGVSVLRVCSSLTYHVVDRLRSSSVVSLTQADCWYSEPSLMRTTLIRTLASRNGEI